MRLRPLLMQLLIGISMSRYFPATGTAGLLRSLVRGKSRVPRPPPRMRLRTFRMRASQVLIHAPERPCHPPTATAVMLPHAPQKGGARFLGLFPLFMKSSLLLRYRQDSG